jgi:hypothetical protein
MTKRMKEGRADGPASYSLCGVEVDGKKKSDEEARKKQIIRLKKRFLCSQSGV